MSLDPTTTALVLIEYQNEFTSDGGALHGAVQEVMEKTGMLGHTAEVVAAQQLTEVQRNALGDHLRRVVGSRVTIDLRVDPSLLGGMVVKIGSRMVDGSLRGQLQRLQLSMKGIG